MSKAQIVGQVFIFMLAAVLFGIILLFGYKAIRNFIDRSDDIALIDLKEDVQSAINSIASSPDVEKRVLTIPRKYTKICFLGNVTDAEKMDTCICDNTQMPPCLGDSTDYNPILCQVWRDGVKQNIFLIPMADLEISVSKMLLDNHYLCVSAVKGKVELRLQGKGDATLIREW